jgi:hypothetical protein
MGINAQSSSRIASVAITVALAFATPAIISAQARPAPDSLSAKVRDSLIAAILADTADVIDAEPVLTLAQPLRQSFSIRPTARRYSVGSVNASEQASYSSWVARFPRAVVRLDLTPVSYKSDTSLVSGRPQVGFSGVSPITGRLDVRLRTSDTLRVFGQSMSFPGELSDVNAQSLGAIGTSTIDLDAGALGAAARLGTRYTVNQPLGDGGLSLMLRGGVEYDPKPSGNQIVSWRGTTLRAGIGLNRSTGNANIGGSVEVTRSFADSLAGRNLFPGGGGLTVEGRATRFVGKDGTGFVSANAFYSRPINIERPDQPTRLIPIGDFAAMTVAGAFPIRELTLIPSASVLRESSSATAVVSGLTTQLAASGYTTSVSLALSVPLGRFVTLTPEIGGAFGSVSQTVSSVFPRRFLRPVVRSQTFSDPIRGGWLALELTLAR